MPHTPDAMIASMHTHDLSQLWSNLLWRSSGVLELPVCLYQCYWNTNGSTTSSLKIWQALCGQHSHQTVPEKLLFKLAIPAALHNGSILLFIQILKDPGILQVLLWISDQTFCPSQDIVLQPYMLLFYVFDKARLFSPPTTRVISQSCHCILLKRNPYQSSSLPMIHQIFLGRCGCKFTAERAYSIGLYP
jgi:hypothetical protein